MAMWEIDSLLTRSIRVIEESELESNVKRHIVWNLERLPEVYGFDAGGFDKSETDSTYEYREIDPFELGLFVSDEAKLLEAKGLVYDWSAFLLNYSDGYFSKVDREQKIEALRELKSILSKMDFSNYQPIHPSLTIYPAGHKSFSETQNNLIKWFISDEI